MRVRTGLVVLLAAAAPFAVTPTPAEPNTAQVCRETANVLSGLYRQRDELEAMIWTGGTHGSHMTWVGDRFELEGTTDNTDWVNQLRNAIAQNKIIADFDEIAKGLRMDRDAPSQGLRPSPRLHADRMAWQKAMLAKYKRLSVEGSRFSVDELDQRHDRLSQQIELRERRQDDLHCSNLPTTATASANGALPLAKSERLQQDRKQNYNAIVYSEYKYSDNSAEMIVQNDPPDRRQVRWTFDGIPGSLNPGDEVKITITGQINLQPPGSEMGANYSAGVRVEGLTQVSAQNAYAYQGKFGDGLFQYTVPANAKKVVIEIGADNGIGTFQRYCYGACSQ